jgi:hypothetical protein
MNHVPADVTVNSPTLIPQGSDSFIFKEVIHRQSSQEGTTTDILITNENGLVQNRSRAQHERRTTARIALEVRGSVRFR